MLGAYKYMLLRKLGSAGGCELSGIFSVSLMVTMGDRSNSKPFIDIYLYFFSETNPIYQLYFNKLFFIESLVFRMAFFFLFLGRRVRALVVMKQCCREK